MADMNLKRAKTLPVPLSISLEAGKDVQNTRSRLRSYGWTVRTETSPFGLSDAYHEYANDCPWAVHSSENDWDWTDENDDMYRAARTRRAVFDFASPESDSEQDEGPQTPDGEQRTIWKQDKLGVLRIASYGAKQEKKASTSMATGSCSSARASPSPSPSPSPEAKYPGITLDSEEFEAEDMDGVHMYMSMCARREAETEEEDVMLQVPVLPGALFVASDARDDGDGDGKKGHDDEHGRKPPTSPRLDQSLNVFDRLAAVVRRWWSSSPL